MVLGLPMMEPAASDNLSNQTAGGLQQSPGYGLAPPASQGHVEPTGASKFAGLGSDAQRRARSAPPAAAGTTGSRPSPLTSSATRPAPLPKRAKGRVFVGTILLAVCVGAAYAVWNSFLRYQAYGTVTGRVIHVSAPWGGIVQRLHTREGELVHQGQPLVTLENMQLDQQRERLGDELRIAQASLDAEVSQLQWQSGLHNDRSRKALAEYYELWGQLLQEQAELAELTRKLERAGKLAKRGTISAEEMDAFHYDEMGQRARVEKLTAAVEEMKKRVELIPADDLADQLKPQLSRIETLQAEISRLREQVGQGEIRAPVNGRVIKTHRFTGEFADASEPILDIVEDGSIEAILFLSQQDSESFSVDQHVNLHVEPYPQPVPCTVVRVGDRLETAPQSIQRYYRANERLLPMYVQPQPGLMSKAVLRLGSEVKLPSGWPDLTSLLPRAWTGAETSEVDPPAEP